MKNEDVWNAIKRRINDNKKIIINIHNNERRGMSFYAIHIGEVFGK